MKKTTAFLLALTLFIGVFALYSAPFYATGNDLDSELESYLELRGIAFDDDLDVTGIASGDDWTLFYVDAGERNDDSDEIKAVLGNRVICAEAEALPFSFGYGVYDALSNRFYDLKDAWDMSFDGLNQAFYQYADSSFKAGCPDAPAMIGDTDRDGILTVVDATHIQRRLAKIEDKAVPDVDYSSARSVYGFDLGFLSDYDRDGLRTILDATFIQRHLAKLLYYYSLEPESVSVIPVAKTLSREKATLVRTRAELVSAMSFALEGDDCSEYIGKYDDEYFKTHSIVVLCGSQAGERSVDSVVLSSDFILSLTSTVTLSSDSNTYAVTLIELADRRLDAVSMIKLDTSYIGESSSPSSEEPTDTTDEIIVPTYQTEPTEETLDTQSTETLPTAQIVETQETDPVESQLPVIIATLPDDPSEVTLNIE